MSKENNIVIVAAYPKIELAQNNFDALVGLVKDKKIKTDGMILVTKDENGEITVNETGDHLGRTGPPPEKDTPAYLHIELRKNDKAIKPDPLLR